jgi:hypothetical protein
MADVSRKPDVFISVDIEADGPIPGPYSMTSIGACVVGDPSQTFYIELEPISDEFVPSAVAIMAEGGLIRDDLLVHGIEAEEAMMRFNAWVEQVCDSTRQAAFVCDTPFDWIFVYWYFMNFLGIRPFGFSCLDFMAYLMGLLRLTYWRDIEIPEQFESDLFHTHNALDDAIKNAGRFAKMLRYAEDLRKREIQG